MNDLLCLGPRGKVLQATARVPKQTIWYLHSEDGSTSTCDNRLRLNTGFEDKVLNFGKLLTQWMRCGQQLELSENRIEEQDPGIHGMNCFVKVT